MTHRPRYITLDVLRTAAIAGMVLYHAAYDLTAWYDVPIDVLHGTWRILARTVACTFLIVSGCGIVIARAGWKHRLRRAATVGVCALLVSGATYVAEPDTYVRFGILHLIAMCLLLLPPLRRLGMWNLALGMAIIIVGSAVYLQPVDTPWLLMLGMVPAGFRSVDYYPLLPWAGVMVIGMGCGTLFQRYASPAQAACPLWIRHLTWPGRHALLVYLLHQPILLFVLRLLHEAQML